jgi:DHA2 family multidrug resistance protein
VATLAEAPPHDATPAARTILPPGPDNPSVNPWIVAISVMLATFMEVLDTTITSVALPYIAGSMAASNSEATWVMTTYLIANAVILPASNWFGLRFGRKRFLLICVGLFIVSSFLCGAAPSMTFLLFARILQGAVGGALQPISQAVLLESFPPKKRGLAMAVFGFGVVVAPVLGPTLGGWLTDAYSWRYAFYINIPVGLLAIFMISRFVHDPPYIKNAKPGAFDNLGFGLLMLWTGCLQIILDKGQEMDWFSATWLRWAFVLLAVSLVWFVVHSWRHHAPLVDLHVITRNRNFGVSCLLVFCMGFVLYIQISLLPLFLQEILGYTALTAGLVVAPRGFGAMAGLAMVGPMTQKVDNRWLIFIGFLMFSFSTYAFSFLDLQMGPGSLWFYIVLAGFGASFLFDPNGNLSTATLPNHEIGNATGIFNLLRNISGSVGISIAQTYLIRRACYHQTRLAASVPLSNAWFQQDVRNMTHYFASHLGRAAAQPAAIGTLYGRLVQQSVLLSFIDVFRWSALVTVACAALAWLYRRVTHHDHGVTVH